MFKKLALLAALAIGGASAQTYKKVYTLTNDYGKEVGKM